MPENDNLSRGGFVKSIVSLMLAMTLGLTLIDEPYPDTYFDFPVASLD